MNKNVSIVSAIFKANLINWFSEQINACVVWLRDSVFDISMLPLVEDIIAVQKVLSQKNKSSYKPLIHGMQ